MFAFAGKVVSAQRLRTNYLSLTVRRERDGLLGPTVQVLVPTLVAVRDGQPQVGAWMRVEAMPAQAADLAEGVRGHDYIACRLQPGAEHSDTPRSVDPAEESLYLELAVNNGSPDKQAMPS